MTKKPPIKRQNPIKIPKTDPDSQPASRKMLKLVRDELKEDVSQVRAEVSQLRVEIRTEMSQFCTEIRAEMTQFKTEVRSEVAQLRTEMKINFSEVKAMAHRTSLLVEEQNANNRIVLEGLQALWQRQDRLEGA